MEGKKITLELSEEELSILAESFDNWFSDDDYDDFGNLTNPKFRALDDKLHSALDKVKLEDAEAEYYRIVEEQMEAEEAARVEQETEVAKAEAMMEEEAMERYYQEREMDARIEQEMDMSDAGEHNY